MENLMEILEFKNITEKNKALGGAKNKTQMAKQRVSKTGQHKVH